MLIQQSQPQLTSSHLKESAEQKSTYALLLSRCPYPGKALSPQSSVLVDLENLLSVLKSVEEVTGSYGRQLRSCPWTPELCKS